MCYFIEQKKAVEDQETYFFLFSTPLYYYIIFVNFSMSYCQRWTVAEQPEVLSIGKIIRFTKRGKFVYLYTGNSQNDFVLSFVCLIEIDHIHRILGGDITFRSRLRLKIVLSAITVVKTLLQLYSYIFYKNDFNFVTQTPHFEALPHYTYTKSRWYYCLIYRCMCIKFHVQTIRDELF